MAITLNIDVQENERAALGFLIPDKEREADYRNDPEINKDRLDLMVGLRPLAEGRTSTIDMRQAHTIKAFANDPMTTLALMLGAEEGASEGIRSLTEQIDREVVRVMDEGVPAREVAAATLPSDAREKMVEAEGEEAWENFLQRGEEVFEELRQYVHEQQQGATA